MLLQPMFKCCLTHSFNCRWVVYQKHLVMPSDVFHAWIQRQLFLHKQHVPVSCCTKGSFVIDTLISSDFQCAVALLNKSGDFYTKGKSLHPPGFSFIFILHTFYKYIGFCDAKNEMHKCSVQAEGKNSKNVRKEVLPWPLRPEKV